MNKLGMHIHGIKPGIIEAVQLLQPRTVAIMDPKPEDIRVIQSVANPWIVVRKYEQGQDFRSVSPERWAEEYYAMVGSAVGPRLVALGWNEPFGHDSRALCSPFDDWTVRFIQTCRQLGPMDGGALAMATGNWTAGNDRYKITQDFPQTCKVARFFLPHEYSWPTLQAGAGWYALRYRAWIQDLLAAGRDDFYFIISECGLTQAIIPGRRDIGWRSGGPEGVTEDSYIATLYWYNQQLCEDSRVLGCCTYDWAGQWYGWSTFEHLGIERRIAAAQAPGEEPPNKEDKVSDELEKVRVWRWDDPTNKHVELTSLADKKALVYDKYAATFRRASVAEGEKTYRLVELWEKRGPATLIVKVLDGSNDPLNEKPVAFHWPEAPVGGDPPTTPHANDWYERFVWGKTNANGDVGFGLGTGAYIKFQNGKPLGGPHAVWVRDPDVKSDIVEKLGMLPMTNHDHLEPVFARRKNEGTSEEDFALQSKTFAAGPSNGIHIVTTGRNFYDTRGSIGVDYLVVKGRRVESDWEAGPFHPVSPTRYEFSSAYDPVAQETDRGFWTTIETTAGRVIGGPYLVEYQTGYKGIWTITVGAPTEPEPKPEPKPEPEPEPEPEPKEEWKMEVTSWPGIRLLCGSLPMPNVAISLVNPWGAVTNTLSGAKPEHGPGGFEFNIWAAGQYTIRFLDQSFQVECGDNSTVRVIFTKQTVQPEPEPEPEPGPEPEPEPDKSLAEIYAAMREVTAAMQAICDDLHKLLGR